MRSYMSRKQEFFSELMGTFILILFGCGGCAMVSLFPSNGHSAFAGEIIKGGYTNIVFGWGLGVTFGIFVSLRISGAHLNPAITLALALVRKFPVNKILHYMLGQLFGAMLAALVVFMVFHAQWVKVDPMLSHTTSVFATFPAVEGWGPGMVDQIVGTFVLMFLILMVGDYAKDIGSGIGYPFIIGAIVLAIGISLGGMNGYAINPARDFGPRLVALMCGFANNGFAQPSVWLTPILGPILGASLAAIFHKLFCMKVHTEQASDALID